MFKTEDDIVSHISISQMIAFVVGKSSDKCSRARAVYHYMLCCIRVYINRDGSILPRVINNLHGALGATYLAGQYLLLSLLCHLWFCNLGVCNMNVSQPRGQARTRMLRFLPRTSTEVFIVSVCSDPIGVHALKCNRETKHQKKKTHRNCNVRMM